MADLSLELYHIRQPAGLLCPREYPAWNEPTLPSAGRQTGKRVNPEAHFHSTERK
jgi:hypothetical protein